MLQKVLLLLDTLQGYQELGIRWERGCLCSWTPSRDIRSLVSGGRGGAPAPGHPAGISGARDQVGEGVLMLLDTLPGYQELGIRWERGCLCSWTPCRDIRSLGSGTSEVAPAPGHPAGISGARDQVGEGVLMLLDTLQGYQELGIR